MKTYLYPAGQMLMAIIVSVMVVACGPQETTSDKTGPASVSVLVVKTQSLQLTNELPGRIEPVRVAEVRARVAGIILSRNFEEGTTVNAGDVLFQIDPAPFRAALSRAQGALSSAEAALAEAKAVVRRYEPLVKIDAVSQQDFDSAKSTLLRARAARQSALADVETAQLNLQYATVRAPISGRIGRALVTEGALVGQNEATPLATIQQIDAVYVDFRQPVAEALRLRDALESGRLKTSTEQGAPISVTVEGTNKTQEGRLLFSDVTVDQSTGQVSLRGQLANTNRLLLPGMYVRVRVTQASDPEAILIPQRAVHRGLDGKPQVYVVGNDDIVELKTIETGTMHGSQWYITEGLNAGDKVIVSGNVQAGEKVKATPLK
ncbi:efflux RND transporter periplasmic adaptor subunit [Escherichia coli]